MSTPPVDQPTMDPAALTWTMAAQKLAKWRRVFAAWHHGITLLTTGPSPSQVATGQQRAEINDQERLLLYRAELSAIAHILIEKGVVSREELFAAMTREAELLSQNLEKAWPGFRSTDNGLAMDPTLAFETMRSRGFIGVDGTPGSL